MYNCDKKFNVFLDGFPFPVKASYELKYKQYNPYINEISIDYTN